MLLAQATNTPTKNTSENPTVVLNCSFYLLEKEMSHELISLYISLSFLKGFLHWNIICSTQTDSVLIYESRYQRSLIRNSHNSNFMTSWNLHHSVSKIQRPKTSESAWTHQVWPPGQRAPTVVYSMAQLRNDTFIVRDSNSDKQEQGSFVRGDCENPNHVTTCSRISARNWSSFWLGHTSVTAEIPIRRWSLLQNTHSVFHKLWFKKILECLATLLALLQSLSYLEEFRKSNSASHSKSKVNNTKPYPAFLHCWVKSEILTLPLSHKQMELNLFTCSFACFCCSLLFRSSSSTLVITMYLSFWNKKNQKM